MAKEEPKTVYEEICEKLAKCKENGKQVALVVLSESMMKKALNEAKDRSDHNSITGLLQLFRSPVYDTVSLIAIKGLHPNFRIGCFERIKEPK